MEKNFFQTKAGGLTIAFIVTMIAFILIMIGLHSGGNVLCGIGFVLIMAAMLYSPIKVYLIDRGGKK